MLPLAAALVLSGVRTAGAVDYSSTILGDHPVAYYEFQEPSGSASVSDSSGNAVSGTVNYVTQSDNVTVYPQLGVAGVDSNAVLFATSTGAGQGDIDVPFPCGGKSHNRRFGITGAQFSAELWGVGHFVQPSGYECAFGQFLQLCSTASMEQFVRLELLSDGCIQNHPKHMVVQPPTQSRLRRKWTRRNLGQVDSSGAHL